MNADTALRRSQAYRFLVDALLYPQENWLDDLPALRPILDEIGLEDFPLPEIQMELPALQAAHRQAFGLTGSLCYETEYGLPNEFRQSQELADISGFYRAFGFQVGGSRRERPDHLAMELEFMHLLALKEAHATSLGNREHAAITQEAQRGFLQDHLGRWVMLFSASLASARAEFHTSQGIGPYAWVGRLTLALLQAEANRLGATLDERQPGEVLPTPLGAELTCGDCALA